MIRKLSLQERAVRPPYPDLRIYHLLSVAARISNGSERGLRLLLQAF